MTIIFKYQLFEQFSYYDNRSAFQIMPFFLNLINTF